MKGRSRAFLGFLVFVVSLAYFVSYSRYGLAYDEGYLLDAVEKLQEGQIIYRDFHHTYAPGRFYLIWACFSLFGKNLVVERVVLAILQATKCLLGFLILSELGAGVFSLLVPMLVAIAPGPWHKVFFSTMGFLGIYAVLKVLGKGAWHSLLAGLVVGIAGIFRQDVAGFTAIAFMVSSVIWSRSQKQPIAKAFDRLGGFIAGGAIAILPVIAYFWSKDALPQMVHKILRDGMLDNMTNRIPYPPLLPKGQIDLSYLGFVLPAKIIFYVPFLAYAAMGIYLIRKLVASKIDLALMGLLTVFIVSLLCFNQSVWRSDVGHLLQTSQYVFLLIGALASLFSKSLIQRFDTKARVKAILFVLPVAFYTWATVACVIGLNRRDIAQRLATEGVSVVDSEYIGSILVRIGNDAKLDIQRAPIMVSKGEAAFLTAIKRFLDENTSPGEYVLGIPQLQFIYFFFDRRNPTRYAHYRRALDPHEEDRYIEDIKSKNTRYILLVEPYEGATIGTTRQPFSVYARRVRSWIFENYEQVGKIGAVRIMRKIE